MILRRPDPVVTHLVDLGVSASAAERLTRGGTLLDLRRGTTLCHHGERGTQAFLLLDGTAQVLTDHGVVPIGPGAVVGEIATLDPDRARTATVVADSDLSVLVFDVATFRSLARDPDLQGLLAPVRDAA